MKKTIFSSTNPNASIFDIPTEEGADESDNRVASIGDATLAHVQSLEQKRLIFDHYIRMPNGNLFSVEENVFWNDPDELNLASEKNLDSYFKKNQIPDKYKDIYREAIQEEEEKRASSEDVMDTSGLVIPYDEWENKPGMMKHWETPKTPGMYMKYCGNTSQLFYDEFPEDHKDAEVINKYLHMMNREIDDIDENYASYVCSWLDSQNILDQVKFVLKQLTEEIELYEEDPVQLTKDALMSIDRYWGRLQYNKAKLNEKKTDPLNDRLISIFKALNKEKKNGASVVKIYATVKSLGRRLFNEKSPFAEEGIPSKMQQRHWKMYRKMKKHFTPPVFINDININTAFKGELVKHLRLSESTARKIIANRPFESIDQVRYAGYFTYEHLIGDNEKLIPFVILIKTAMENSLKVKDSRIMEQTPSKILTLNKTNKTKLTSDEFNKVWKFFNIKKTSMLRQLTINNKKEQLRA